MANPLLMLWKTFRDDYPGFDSGCGKMCPKFGAALQDADRCLALVASSKDVKSSRQALADGEAARKLIDQMLSTIGACVVKQKDAKLQAGFKTVSALIAKQVADF